MTPYLRFIVAVPAIENLVAARSPNFASPSVVCTPVHPQRVLSSSSLKTKSNNQGWEVYTYIPLHIQKKTNPHNPPQHGEARFP